MVEYTSDSSNILYAKVNKDYVDICLINMVKVQYSIILEMYYFLTQINLILTLRD